MYQLPTFRVKLVRERARAYPVDKADCYGAAVQIFMHALRDVDREHMLALHLNNQNTPLGLERVAIGGAAGIGVTVRDVLKGAILSNAASIILCHNHPSGNPKPSAEDLAFTAGIKQGLEAVGLALLDHIVVCPTTGRHSSMRETGLL